MCQTTAKEGERQEQELAGLQPQLLQLAAVSKMGMRSWLQSFRKVHPRTDSLPAQSRASPPEGQWKQTSCCNSLPCPAAIFYFPAESCAAGPGPVFEQTTERCFKISEDMKLTLTDGERPKKQKKSFSAGFNSLLAAAIVSPGGDYTL